jgi:hypothetical protein
MMRVAICKMHMGVLAAYGEGKKEEKAADAVVGLGLFSSGMHSSQFVCISSELKTQFNNESA